MDLIDAAVNPYHILRLKKQLNKAELKNVHDEIDEQYLITLLWYYNTKGEKNTSQNSNYIGVGDRVKAHKDQMKK